MVYLVIGSVFMTGLFLRCLTQLSELINSYEFLISSRHRPQDFSRKGKIGFVNAIGFVLNFINKTMQIELDNFFKAIGAKISVSKQAFSEARQKISPDAFREMFSLTAKNAVVHESAKTYAGYRLIPIDGSTLSLENSDELIEYFGCSGAKSGACTAKISIAYDVLNDAILDASIDKYGVGELKLAMAHIDKVLEIGIQNPVFILDRGYASNELIAKMDESHYIMRIKRRWNGRDIDKTPSGGWFDLLYKKKTYHVRVIKIRLPSGEKEILFTNLKEFSAEDFYKLYALRWPIEMKYDVVKSKLMLENFTGKTLISVMQDFWATMTLANLLAFAKLDSDTVITKADKDKDLKYEYQTNTNILIGKLKDNLVKMLLTQSPLKRNRIFRSIMREIIRNKVPIRNDRKVERKPPRRNKRFFIARKLSL